MNPETELFQQLCQMFLTLSTSEEKRGCLLKMRTILLTGSVN